MHVQCRQFCDAAHLCPLARTGRGELRLIPHFGPQGAAAIYRKLLAHTVDTARASEVPFALRVTGAEPARFSQWLGSDVWVVPQGDGDLSEKLASMPTPGIALGSDCPGVTAELLREAAAALGHHNSIIGPALDGGFWALGLNLPDPSLFADMAWSTNMVFAEMMRRQEAQNASVKVLPTLGDIDEPRDLDEWPEFLP